MLISLLRKIIPDKVRIPAFIVIIATFVTLVQMVVKKFLPDLNETLGVFLPLIVVNCVILARAEAFASTNGVFDSALDGIGMGIGFTISLFIIGFIRELLGAGTVLSGFFGNGFSVVVNEDMAMAIFTMAPGGFLIYGLLMALVNYVFDKQKEKNDKKTIEPTDMVSESEVSHD